MKIHPAHRAHTAGSQLLEVPTSVGKLVFGSDAYSSWEGIRDWMMANPQQTDTVQQFLAYEKCYKITGGYQNCVAAHEPLVLHRRVSADQELLGRHQRRAHGGDRPGTGGDVAQAALTAASSIDRFIREELGDPLKLAGATGSPGNRLAAY